LSAFIMTALLALLALGLSFSYFPAAAYAAPSPHLGGVGDASCKSCHVPHRATTARSMMKGGNEGAEGEVPTCFLCHDGTAAVSNVKTGPDSFAGVSGHALEDATTPEEAVDLTNACSSCHKPHGDYATNPKLPAPLINGAAVTAAGTVWCLACHNDEQDWYDAIGVYPALDTPSRDATGYPVVGTYPGATVYLDETANPHAKIPAQAEPTARVAGDCLYCHSAHRGPNGYDGLNATFRPSKTETAASDRTDGTYAAACFQCHDGSRADATNIKQFVTHEATDETLMASSRAPHQDVRRHASRELAASVLRLPQPARLEPRQRKAAVRRARRESGYGHHRRWGAPVLPHLSRDVRSHRLGLRDKRLRPSRRIE
jgi:hypothetical protein